MGLLGVTVSQTVRLNVVGLTCLDFLIHVEVRISATQETDLVNGPTPSVILRTRTAKQIA